MFTAFIDFKKAFDYINRDLLCYRLGQLGIRGPFLELVKTIHQHTSNVLRINGRLSGTFASENGVLQGNPASPTYFSSYINGLLCELKASGLGISLGSSNKKVCVLAYADDLVLLVENELDLQSLLDITRRWCEKWHVQINTDKTKVVHFRRKRIKRTLCKFSVGKELEIVETYRYLGFTVDSHLTCSEGVKQLCGAASRALGSVIGKTKDNYDLSYSTYSKLFNSGSCQS